MGNDFKFILDKLNQWKQGGEEVLKNGTVLICKVPHIAPKAWFHIKYAPLTLNQISEMEQDLSNDFPVEVKQFLLTSNGLNIFSDSLSIYGKRTSYSRNVDEAKQPYDLVDLHNEVAEYLPKNYIVIGSYSWDGSHIVCDLNLNTIHRCEQDSGKILNTWNSLSDFLREEIARLTKLFDEYGVEYDEDVPTTP
jgi:hypothetical protein